MMKLYDKNVIKNEKMMFSDKQVWLLLIPVALEQFLNSFMGMADTMMVSRVGSAAISAVSLVDSINVLVIQIFAALAAGATIICSQFIGKGDKKRANEAALQINLTVFVISVVLTILGLVFYRPILKLIFGAVDADVMRASETYFVITVLSFPFIALFNAGSSFYRAGGETRFPMIVSVISNVLNIAGNYVLIFVFGMGVEGAALSTLVSRIFCMAVIYIYLRKENQIIVLNRYFVKPDYKMIMTLLAVGIPSGIENGMFQFGKLAIQSSVSLLGTKAIAANAMVIVLENINGIAGMAMGIGLMTVVGQCIGAGKIEQAKYYIVKVTVWAWWIVLACVVITMALTNTITSIAGMDGETAKMCFDMMVYITVLKPIVWTLSFVPGYGMRAAGDVKFSMITSSLTMWFVRVAISVFLIRCMGFGPIAVWIGMSADWTARAILFTGRFMSGKWTKIKVI